MHLSSLDILPGKSRALGGIRTNLFWWAFHSLFFFWCKLGWMALYMSLIFSIAVFMRYELIILSETLRCEMKWLPVVKLSKTEGGVRFCRIVVTGDTLQERDPEGTYLDSNHGASPRPCDLEIRPSGGQIEYRRMIAASRLFRELNGPDGIA